VLEGGLEGTPRIVERVLPMACPSCGMRALTAAVYIDAMEGDLFEVVGPDERSADRVLVRRNDGGRLRAPEELILMCDACGWTDDRFITWADR
jgi:hypothetical protein